MTRNNLFRNLILFLVNGSIYYGIEYVWKHFITKADNTHWSMFLLGGLCGLLIGLLNERKLTWEMGLLRQGIYGAGIVTGLEFTFGVILNMWLKLGIWDYSNLPLNILGQVCLPFSLAWFVLSLVAIVLDDFLRHKLLGDERYHYHWLDHKLCE